MHQSLYYAGIRTQKYIGRVDESQTFDIVVLDWDSNPIPEIDVVVEIVKSEWHSVQEQDEYGQLHWVTTIEETPVTEITDPANRRYCRVEAELSLRKAALIRPYVTVIDENGGQHTASTRIWVSSRSYVSWRQTNDNSFELIQNKDAYSPGETAEILIAQPLKMMFTPW